MNYGLRLNWKKCEVLPVGCEASIAAPDGSYLTCKSSISYLGGYLDATGAGGSEICRRLGEAKGHFDKLGRVWRHSTLHPQQKIRIFQACVVSKLLYCLHTIWLNKAESRKILKQSASVLSFISHLRTSVVFQTQRCCRETTANACPTSWNSDSYVYFNSLQRYLMMMSADHALSNAVALFCKTCQLHAAWVAPNKYGFPKYIEWRWKLPKVLTCEVIYESCVTVHEANEWMNMSRCIRG